MRPRVEAGQKVTLVERQRLLQLWLTARGDQSLKTGHIDVQPQGIHRHRVGVDDENAGTAKRASQHRQRLPETLPRLGVADVGPQERGQPITRMGTPRTDRQTGQQSAHLPRGDRHDSAGGAPTHLHVTQETHDKACHASPPGRTVAQRRATSKPDAPRLSRFFHGR